MTAAWRGDGRAAAGAKRPRRPFERSNARNRSRATVVVGAALASVRPPRAHAHACGGPGRADVRDAPRTMEPASEPVSAAQLAGDATELPMSAPRPVQLVLRRFSAVPEVAFGAVPVGVACLRSVEVCNPAASAVPVTIDSFPLTGDFSVDAPAPLIVPGGGSATLQFVWLPRTGGKVCLNVQLLVSGRHRFRVLFTGTAVAGPTVRRRKEDGKSAAIAVRRAADRRSPIALPRRILRESNSGAENSVGQSAATHRRRGDRNAGYDDAGSDEDGSGAFARDARAAVVRKYATSARVPSRVRSASAANLGRANPQGPSGESAACAAQGWIDKVRVAATCALRAVECLSCARRRQVERGFVAWMNFVLLPADEGDIDDTAAATLLCPREGSHADIMRAVRLESLRARALAFREAESGQLQAISVAIASGQLALDGSKCGGAADGATQRAVMELLVTRAPVPASAGSRMVRSPAAPRRSFATSAPGYALAWRRSRTSMCFPLLIHRIRTSSTNPFGRSWRSMSSCRIRKWSLPSYRSPTFWIAQSVATC